MEREYAFILDTGAGATILSRSVFDELGMQPAKVLGLAINSSSSSARGTSVTKIKKLELGGVTFRDVGAVVMDDARMGMLSCFVDGGVLGVNVLSRCALQINYQDSTIILSDDPTRLATPGHGFDIPFALRDGSAIPKLPVVLNDTIAINVTLNTGSSGLLVLSLPHLADVLDSIPTGRIARYTRLEPLFFAEESEKARVSERAYVQAESLQIGPATFEDLPVVVTATDDELADGLLGNQFFENYVVTVDWTTRIARFRPIPGRDLPTRKSILGLGFRPCDGKIRVSTIYQLSQADRKDLEVEDEIVDINGVDVQSLSEEELCAVHRGELLFSSSHDDTITVTVAKNGQITTHQLGRFELFQ